MARTIAKKTAKNDWGLLSMRASMLYHAHLDHAPVRTKRFWKQYQEARKLNDILDAYLSTEAFRLSFKR